MNIIRTGILIVASLAVAACSKVTSKTPVGDAPIPAQSFIGVWQAGPHIIYVTDKDAKNGIVRVSNVQIDQKTKQLSLNTFDCYVRRSGSSTFVSIKDAAPTDNGAFAFGLVDSPYHEWENDKNRPQQFILKFPNVATFARFVDKGDLHGTVEKGSSGDPSGVQIEGINEREASALEQPSSASAFGYGVDSSIIVTRRPDLVLPTP